MLTNTIALAQVEGWKQLGELFLAVLLSGAIGFERSLTGKAAGLRTYSLVGVGAALWVLISKYGFGDVLSPGLVVVDPSRVAAQVVVGVSFLGAGLIFVKRGGVRGLTTAAGIWVTAAIGAAAGAGLIILSLTTTVIYFLIMGARYLLERITGNRSAESQISVTYPRDTKTLARVLRAIPENGFTMADVQVHSGPEPGTERADLRLSSSSRAPIAGLAVILSEIKGVEIASAAEPSSDDSD